MSNSFSNIVVKEEDVFANFLNLVDPSMESLKDPSAPQTSNEDPTDEKRQHRLAKNRESARITRIKKKEHLEFLEKRLADLIEEVETLRTETSSTKVMVDASIRENFLSNKQVLFRQLEDLLENGGSESEISGVLEVLRNKLGASGVEREGYIEFLMHQVEELSMPAYLKEMIERYDWESFPSQVREVAFRYKRSMSELKKIRKCLMRRTAGLEDLIDYCETLLDPRQIASILVRLNRSEKFLSPWEVI